MISMIYHMHVDEHSGGHVHPAAGGATLTNATSGVDALRRRLGLRFVARVALLQRAHTVERSGGSGGSFMCAYGQPQGGRVPPKYYRSLRFPGRWSLAAFACVACGGGAAAGSGTASATVTEPLW